MLTITFNPNDLPDEIPAGIKTNVERMARALNEGEYAIVEVKAEDGGDSMFMLCTLEKEAGGGAVIVRTLAQIIDALQTTDVEEVSLQREIKGGFAFESAPAPGIALPRIKRTH